MEMLTNDKHSSLMRKSLIYGQKSFITLAPGRSPSVIYLCLLSFIPTLIIKWQNIYSSIPSILIDLSLFKDNIKNSVDYGIALINVIRLFTK
jgi:hypothetical protein